MSFIRSSHLVEASAYSDFGVPQAVQGQMTYSDVVPLVQVMREVVGGGFALILTTPFLHIYEVWINCVSATSGFIFADYEGIVGGPGVFVDTAVYVGQTLVLTDLITPDEGGFPFFIITVPGVNDDASFVYSIFGTSIL